MVIMKETEEEEFWVRLLKDKVQEKGQCSIDWDKYVDEVREEGGRVGGREGEEGAGACHDGSSETPRIRPHAHPPLAYPHSLPFTPTTGR